MKGLAIIFSFLFLILTSCEISNKNKYNTGTFPGEPVNLGDINSEYDDYNSASPIIGEAFPLCFSSNRHNQGVDFDIIYKLLDVHMERENGKLTVAENTNIWNEFASQNANILNALSHLNTSSDELGPYLIPQAKNYNYEGRNSSYIFLYSTNEGGNQDIRFVHNLDGEYYNNPKPVSYLNSDEDDAYPSLSKDFSTLYFCSDREANFDIYTVSLDTNMSLLSNLEDSIPKAVILNAVLSSDSDDKCPFVLNNLIVFTSNRPGGFGGFDLYYALYKAGKWSDPVNFGNKINTQYDEYRPIVKPMQEFTNDFMLFSSNRPGGKGGFDLYYVGIDRKLTE